MAMLKIAISLVLISAISCLAVIVERVRDLPGLEYDFVIIGGGTAGNVIANRLTENAKHTVLVLEAGVSNADVLNSMVPFFCPRLTPNTAFDWNYTTTPQDNLNGRVLAYPRGHILGGSSSINFMAYTRGSSDDYDRYARLTRDAGWSWDRLQPYFRKNERFTPPADDHNTTGQFNPAFHSFRGINSVSLAGFPQPIDGRVIQTTTELPGEFPFNMDTNSGNQLGIGWTQSTIGGGVRSSSATSYLGPQFVKRRNLHVLLHAQVARLIHTGSSRGNPAFREVEFTDGVGGPRRRARARKEVILSAGSIGTPHILLNSGIGDATDLTRVGIRPLVHLPSVGRNLSDHPFVVNQWLVNSVDTFETINRNATVAAADLQLWTQEKMGPLVDGAFNHNGWIRVPRNTTIFNKFPDPSAGPHTAHFEFVISNGLSHVPLPTNIGNNSFFVVSTAVLTPVSRGSITINSSDPFAPPLINPNFLSSEPDISIMREAIRSARHEELNEFIRENASSFFHPVGTAGMSPRGARYGVVDPDLRVKGVDGLRIVDASVLPIVPAGHTQAATYVFAERAADLIKKSW
ncbi:Pyranose dehydrogenase [Hypsizygus marmoreus]|uniref:Pyranose dehydrogenase n=1 Tax=Hypsizygus marmoreus TaxID=39966 RepID=A0A369J5S0_HYPMA|nr:Pyranose dehydrogenase [Hypsizygus marmoreus]